MKIARACLAVTALMLALGSTPGARGQVDDYGKAVKALKPDHFYRLNEPELGPPQDDGIGNPVPVDPLGVNAKGTRYDSQVVDEGFAAELIHGYHDGKFDPIWVDPPLAMVGALGPIGLCGFDEANLAFFANNAGSINLGPGSEFANDVMTVSLWFTAAGSEGGDRIFTNNQPTIEDHFQITLGAGANLVIGINPQGETVSDSLQVPDSAKPVKDNQWHHLVASRNGPTMDNVLVVIDGVDYSDALVDSTTGWGVTGTDARLGSRPGGDGGDGCCAPPHMTLNGSLDEVAVWLGRQLTVGEAIDLYNAALGCIPPAQVAREISQDTYSPGEGVLVTLRVTADAPGTDIYLEELLPELAQASEISDQGSQVDRTVQWNLKGISTKDVTYRITAPPCAGELEFGEASFQVGAARGRVVGEVRLPRAPGAPDCSVVRELSQDSYGPGDSIVVSLKITADLPGTDAIVDEALPPEALVTDVSDSGVLTDQTIHWNLIGLSQKTVSYRISAPPCAGDLVFGAGNVVMGALTGAVGGKPLVAREPGEQDLGPWQNADLVATGGFTDALGDHELYIQAQGAGVRQNKDEFRFVHLAQNGDFEFSARLDCADDKVGTGQAGIMVRDTLDAFSANVFFYLTPDPVTGGGTLKGLYRRETNSVRSVSPVTIAQKDVPALPVWLKLKRTGTTISLQRSPDGATYTEVSTKEIGSANTTQVNLQQATLVGLGVAAGTGTSARAIFGGVSGPGFLAPAGTTFRRGDSDSSGTVDLTDAVRVLGFLFLAGENLECVDAADFDDGGVLDISDAVANLNFQFLGGPEPAPPGPLNCGLDAGAEASDLGCAKGCGGG